MRANYKIPAPERCAQCKGWGQFENPAKWHQPHHPQDGYTQCRACKGTGRVLR